MLNGKIQKNTSYVNEVADGYADATEVSAVHAVADVYADVNAQGLALTSE